MADAQLDTQAAPSGTPAAGKAWLWIDSTTKKLVTVDDTGRQSGILSRNDAIASQTLGVADTYITNSGLLIPSGGMKAGQLYQWLISASKTAAGVAAAVYTVRIGAAQSTADTARLALTTVAQTGVADNGLLVVTLQVRNVAAAGVVAGVAAWAKTQTGLIGFGGSIDGVAAGFDNTALAGQYVGLSINPGAASAWTLTTVAASLLG